MARICRPSVLTLVYAVREFNADAGFERAASLAYKFLISLVPLLAVALALFVAFAPLQEYSDQVESFLFDALLPPGAYRAESEGAAPPGEGETEARAEEEGESTDEGAPAEEPSASEEPASDEALASGEDSEAASDEERDRLLTSSEMREYLSEITRQLQTSSGSLGLIGTLFLFVTTLSLFNTIETSINRIWKVKKRRPAVRKFQAFWSIVSLGPLLLGASLFLTGRLAEQNFLGPLTDSALADILRVMVPFFCSFVAIYLVYQFVPYTRVRVPAAILGAVVAAGLWELGKFGFRMYLTRAVSFEQIYGALGTIPVLLLWLYLSWTVVLYGSEVAYVWQNLPAVRKQRAHGRHKMLGSLLPIAIALLLEIARRFREGKPPGRPLALAGACPGVEEIDARHCLHLLAAAHLVHRVDGSGFLIARPAASIRLLDIADALGEGAQDLETSLASDTVPMEPLRRAWRRRDEVLSQVSLAELLDVEAAAPSERSTAASR